MPSLPICVSSYHFGPSWSEVAVQLPDKLSGSEISDNSSGIKSVSTHPITFYKFTSIQVVSRLKNNFCSSCAEVEIVIGNIDFVQLLHEITSRQFGERGGTWVFHLFPNWEQVGSKVFSKSLVPKLGTS